MPPSSSNATASTSTSSSRSRPSSVAPHLPASTSSASTSSTTSSSSSSSSTSSTRPALLPTHSKPDAPALSRVFARGQQRRGLKSAMGSLPRPSPLRKELSFGDGFGNGNGRGSTSPEEERDKGKKRAFDGPDPAYTNGASESAFPDLTIPDEPNKRPKLSDPEPQPQPATSLPPPGVLPLQQQAQGAPSTGSRSWWSWSSPNLPTLANPSGSAASGADPAFPGAAAAAAEPQVQAMIPDPLPSPGPPSAAGELSAPETSAAALLLAASSPSPQAPAASAPAAEESKPKPGEQTLNPKRSWFGSFGRRSRIVSQGSEVPPVPPLPPAPAPAAAEPEAPGMQRASSDTSALSATSAPLLQTSASAPPSTISPPPPRPSSPIPIPSTSTLTPARTPTPRPGHSRAPSAFSQPGTPPPSLLPLESPDTRVPTPAFLRSSAPDSLASSPGEEVGRLMPAQPSGLSGLNASALRYTLSLPLLGRAKRSMEVVRLVEQEAGEGERERALVQPGEGKVDVVVVPPTPAGNGEAEKQLPAGTNSEQAAAEAAWWWSYLGFSPSPAPANASVNVNSGPAPAVADPEASDILPPLSPLPPHLHPLPPPQQHTPDAPQSSSMSVVSADTGRTRGGSVWYQPWYWYTAPALPAPEPEGGDGKTEAERVKEDALAREAEPEAAAAAAAPSTADQHPQPEPPKQVQEDAAIGTPSNPLTSASNMPMWVSFFSAGRNPAARAIKQHESMEVMDIDDEPAAPAPAPSASASPGSAGQVGSPGTGSVAPLVPATAALTVSAPKEEGKRTAAKEAARAAGCAKEAVRAARSQSRDPLRAAGAEEPKPGTSAPKDGSKPSSKPASIAPEPAKTGTSPTAPGPPAPTGSAVPSKAPANAPEPQKDVPAPPLTTNPKPKKALEAKRAASITSKKDKGEPVVPVPNFLLPTFQDVFYHPPLSIRPPETDGRPSGALKKTMRYVNKFLGAPPNYGPVLVDPELAEYQRRLAKGKGKQGEEMVPSTSAGQKRQQERMKMEGMPAIMPRSWAVLGLDRLGEMRTVKKAVIIGIHGWFPGAMLRSVLGEPTGTSAKFVQMQRDALVDYLQKHDIQLEQMTEIPLEGEGTIQSRLDRLYATLTSNEAWMTAIHEADIILFATHSQGSVVTCHIMDRLLDEGHIYTGMPQPSAGEAIVKLETQGPPPPKKAQRVVCLALCGIHLGPLLYLNTSVLTQPWLHYLESSAARELFEFQDSESEVSKRYVDALARVLDRGCKFVYIASLNDQVVPIYSGTFVNASHPLILRGLYIDGDAYSSTDFLTNLLVLCLRLRNAGLTDGGLVVHLSEATAGSLNGVGHSTAYEEMSCYTLAVRFLFETNHSPGVLPPLELEPFSARESRNDYEIPWILNELVTHPAVQEWFLSEIEELRAAFDDWKPRTAALRDIRRKLEPIKRKGRGLNRIVVVGPSRL
ncbi:hypothetical protein CALVIDRAFT_601440 [Calocera viscosa TUFC12733]|uniref:YMC020W-like alpha/beta hydrolase domain-containing protein n=1 Tax=Calocera viscosa (strain TUFC12733) TaxID=1330018 RepID=A0A167I9W2_CALVF|nr:hypothetical protein CALVIDRAFT_601440 [Calocera viscosa TUFC12733]